MRGCLLLAGYERSGIVKCIYEGGLREQQLYTAPICVAIAVRMNAWKGERAEQTLVFKFDFIFTIMIIHSDKSARGTRHVAKRLARLAMGLAISMTSTIPAPSTE